MSELGDHLRASTDQEPHTVRGYVIHQDGRGWDDELMDGISHMLKLGYDIVLVPLSRGQAFCPTIPNPQRAATPGPHETKEGQQ